ncbi:MAG: hypothetical protein ACYTBS_22155 [Planctomycetota bacterium]
MTDYFDKCPECEGPLTPQYDTQEEEAYLRCDECWLSFTIDLRPTICDTAIPEDEV